MAKFELDDFGLKFEIPDRITVRAQMRYWSVVHGEITPETMFERTWVAAAPLIEKWDCPDVDPKADIDEVFDPQVFKTFRAAGMAVFSHMLELRETPKN